MSSYKAANKPSDLEARFHGQDRQADGYQYWTTSEEDEEAADERERFTLGDEVGDNKTRKKANRGPLLPKGTLRRTGVRLSSMLLLLVLAGLAYFGFGYYQVASAAGDDLSTVAPSDAIVVLGAAQYDGTPSNVLQERLDHAYNLYNQGVAPVIMTTGAGQEGDVTTEGLVGLQHLLSRGVPESDILVIPEGTNSWEQLSASQFQMEQNDFDTVILVSDTYHNYRLLAIADELGIDASLSPSAIDGTITNRAREAVAVSIGRITDYRRLSAFTEDG